MNEITLHFHGDMEINAPQELLKGLIREMPANGDGALQAPPQVTGDDIAALFREYGETYAVYAVPGETVRIMRLTEVLEENALGHLDRVTALPGYDLMIAYSSDLSVECDQELYIFGPLVAFCTCKNEICDVDTDDVYITGKILDEAAMQVTDVCDRETMAFIFTEEDHERI